MVNQKTASYLKTLNSLSINELIHLINHPGQDQKAYKILACSCVLVNRYLKFYSSELSSIQLALTSVLSIFHRRFVIDKELTLKDIEKLIKKELNIVSNITFNGVTNFKVEEKYEIDVFNNMMINESKREILDKTPDHLKLSMCVFLYTGKFNIKAYPEIDRFLFTRILFLEGYKMESLITLDEKIDNLSLIEKIIFLLLLKELNKTIFIFYVSFGNFNQILLLSELKTLGLPRTSEIISSMEEILIKVEKISSENEISKRDYQVVEQIAKTLQQEDMGDVNKLMIKIMNNLYNNWDKSISQSALRPGILGKSEMCNLYNTEINKQLNFIRKLKKTLK